MGKHAWNEQRHVLRVQILRLNLWIADLQSGAYITCVYCGHRYWPRDEAATSIPDAKTKAIAEALAEHIRECKKHPMFGLRELLIEWLETPFYETREAWEEWVKAFRPRVEEAVYGEEKDNGR